MNFGIVVRVHGAEPHAVAELARHGTANSGNLGSSPSGVSNFRPSDGNWQTYLSQKQVRLGSNPRMATNSKHTFHIVGSSDTEEE